MNNSCPISGGTYLNSFKVGGNVKGGDNILRFFNEMNKVVNIVEVPDPANKNPNNNKRNINELSFENGSREDMAKREITEHYSLLNAVKCIIYPQYAHEQNVMLNKNEAIILSCGIKKMTGWPDKSCHDLAIIIQDSFASSYPNPINLKKTILDVIKNNPHLTIDKLVNGPLNKAITANSRAASHLSKHGGFNFKAKIKPPVLMFEWLISTLSPALCLEKNRLEQGAKTVNEIRAIDNEIDMIQKRRDNLKGGSKRMASIDIHCLESWKVLLKSPESDDARREFIRAFDKRNDFINTRNKSIDELRAERAHTEQATSGSAGVDKPLLPVTTGVAITVPTFTNGIRHKTFAAAVIGTLGLFSGAGYAIYRSLQSPSVKDLSAPVDTPPAATYKSVDMYPREDTNHQESIDYQSMNCDGNAAFAFLQNTLESELSAVVADEKGRLWVPSLSDNLRELHEQYGDTPTFIKSALAILKNHGLLEDFYALTNAFSEGTVNILKPKPQAVPASVTSFKIRSPVERHNQDTDREGFHRTLQLVESSELLTHQKESITIEVLKRKRRAIPVGETSAQGQQSQPVSLSESAQIDVLNSIIVRNETDYSQSKSIYFRQWIDSLPRENSYDWLRNADEDKQMAYKDLLDYAASAGMSLKNSAQQLISEQQGMSEITQRLRKMNLPLSPNLIRLKANVNQRAGSLSVSVPTDMSLTEAWHTGMLNKFLSEPGLVIQNNQERQYLDEETLRDFRREFHDIASPASAKQLMEDARVQHAYGKLIDVYFSLSTLEEELKGRFRRNDHISGLEIINKFRQGSSDVKAGQLVFSVQDTNQNELRIPLTGWLVLQEITGRYVLYDADINTGGHYFPNQDSMFQFISKKSLSDNMATGRLKDAVLAEQVADGGQLIEFFDKFAENADVWRRQKASLIFAPDNSKTFDQAMSSFAGRMMARKIAHSEYNEKIREAAVRAVSLRGNWESVMGNSHMTSLQEFTRNWIKSNSAYGQFLTDAGVYSRAEDFDPDEVFIQAPQKGKIGTITEFASIIRRQYPEGEGFADGMEVLPKTVKENNYVNALNRQQKKIFAAELQQAIDSGTVTNNPATANGRYIATLPREDKLNLNEAFQLYRRLNGPRIKSALDAALRVGYPGTLYQQDLKDKLNFSHTANIKLRNAWNAAQVAKMQYSLETAKISSKAISVRDANRITQLLKEYPGKSSSGYDSLAPLTLGNVRVPGMVMFTLRDSIAPGPGNKFKSTQYVFTPEPINGNHLFVVDDFNALIKRSAGARDIVASMVALKDAGNINEAFKNAYRGRHKAGYAIDPKYDMFTEMVNKLIDDADEQTVSQWEVIRDAAVFGAGLMSLPLCLMAGPSSAVMCAAVTAITLADDFDNASDLWERGDHGYAIMSMLPGLLDITDVTKVLRMAGRVAGIGRSVGYIANTIPPVMKGVSGGLPELLKLSGLKKFGTAMDVSSALHESDRYSMAFEGGWLKREWAVNVDLSTYERLTTNANTAGKVFEKDGFFYIRERNYPEEPFLIYQVKVEAGSAVRVINPAHPNVPADRIKWQGGKWVKETSGLRGGIKLSDLEIKNRLHKLEDIIDNEAARANACDTKTQRVLRVLEKDKELWNSLEGRMEVRMIKAKSDDLDDEIILHPAGESIRWQGRYHVYLVVNIGGKKMVIDPYIGGPDACAKVSEEVFNKQHWKGKPGVDYDVITFAPSREEIVGEDGYYQMYEIRDFMNSETIFEPETYQSHAKFMYGDGI